MEKNLGVAAENTLYDAAATGDVKALHELLKNDPLLLERVSFTCPNKTPLHVATTKGHLAFVREILNRSPHLAEESDIQQSSALHIASAKGYVEIVKELLLVAPETCFSRDFQGRNPLNLAAMKGQVQVLAELVQRSPVAAREKLDGGITVLHSCVKHNQLEALRILVKTLNDLLNTQDDEGDTILHMAVKNKQNETIQYLVGSTTIDVNAKNSSGKTAFDIFEQRPTDKRDSEIRKILRPRLITFSHKTQTHPEKWLSKKRDTIMVVAVLMATMAFQAGVTPPGGVWQEDLINDLQGNPVPEPHKAGEAVMAYNYSSTYQHFLRVNTVVFVSSLSTILLLISGLPFRRRLFMWILMVIMWLTVTSIAVTYAISVVVITPRKDRHSVSDVMRTGTFVWIVVMGILLVGNTARLIYKWSERKGIKLWVPRKFRNTTGLNHENYRQDSV